MCFTIFDTTKSGTKLPLNGQSAELHGRLSTFRGVKGTLELTAGGDLLFVPRRKRKEPVKIGNFDMVRQLWIIEDGKAGEYLCLD